MVLDLHRPVAAAGCDHEHVRPAYTSSPKVCRQPCSQEHGHVLDGDGGHSVGRVIDYPCRPSERFELGDGGHLEGVALVKSPLDLRPNRPRGNGSDHVVLRPHRAAPGDVATLRWDQGEVWPRQTQLSWPQRVRARARHIAGGPAVRVIRRGVAGTLRRSNWARASLLTRSRFVALA